MLGVSIDNLDDAPMPDPRQMALKRIRETMKGDDDEALGQALDDYLELRNTKPGE